MAARYELEETPNDKYIERTEWNVRDSDGTVIISISSSLSGGSRNTAEFADQHRKPWVHISEAREGGRGAELLQEFLTKHRVRVLNVAGPRAYAEPSVGAYVKRVLDGVLQRGNLGNSPTAP